jgi:hypothetical protein
MKRGQLVELKTLAVADAKEFDEDRLESFLRQQIKRALDCDKERVGGMAFPN